MYNHIKVKEEVSNLENNICYLEDRKKRLKMSSFKGRILPLILTTGIALGIIGGSFLGKKVRPVKSTVITYCQNDDSYYEEEIEGRFFDGVYLKLDYSFYKIDVTAKSF